MCLTLLVNCMSIDSQGPSAWKVPSDFTQMIKMRSWPPLHEITLLVTLTL